MAIPKSRAIIVGITGFVIIFFVLVFLGVIPGRQNPEDRNKTALTFWGVFETSAVINELTAALGGQYAITYRQFDPQNYETELVNALAAGKGPDMFMVHNTWIPKHYDKLAPVPESQLTVATFRQLYPTVAEQDFAPDGLIYALPLSIDTLALYYNQDLFDSEGIALPPTTWTDFQNLIPRLRELDSGGRVVRAGAAIGGSNKSISRATDILSLLMLQSGSPMVSSDFSRADFGSQGAQALKFYTDFANPADKNFTWTDTFKNSLDGFADESIAMMLGYAYHMPTIENKNPFLKYRVAPLPQPSGSTKSVNYGNYWGIGVSNRTQNYSGAWSYILAMTADPAAGKRYTDRTGKPPALRSLIQIAQTDASLGVFATQALSARSWPQIDNVTVEQILSKVIEDVINGRKLPAAAIQEAQSSITSLMAAKQNSSF
ncbi:MAG: extracellular solute-binding protein [Patescibacteria group bacterium]